MASYTVKNYSAYASSMAKPSSSSTSSKLDSKGYTPVSTTAKPTTAAAKTYQKKYAARDNYESPSSSKSKPSMGLGAPTKKPTAVAAPTVEDRFANAWTLSGGSNYDNPMSQPPSAIGVYETPKAQELVNYMTSAGIQDALYEAQGLINQNYTPQMQMSVRPMTADEIKKFVPVQNLNNSGITVEQLSSMDAPMQKATLESLGITNAQWVSSQGMYPMSLQEFDDITMDSVHYGQPLTRDPKNAMYNQLQQPTQQGLGYTGTDVAPTMPSAEQVAIMPDAPGMMSPATLGETPAVDSVSNELLQKPSTGLMSRRLDEKGATPEPEFPLNIDFEFIAQQEGKDRKDMYVPMDTSGYVYDSSGPTIATGVDIGQKSPSQLKGLPKALQDKLIPYTNKKGQAAADYVAKNPLNLTQDEVNILNRFAKKEETESLIKLWERDSDIPWKDLTTEQATTVASVMYQYGSKRVKTPKFWNAVTTGDWEAAEAELRNFGDKYPSRRTREANLLAKSPTTDWMAGEVSRDDTTLDQSPVPMARPEAKAAVEAKVENATTVPEVTAAVTEAAVSTMPQEEAKQLLTNPVQWVYSNNLVGLDEDTEEGKAAIDGFFRTAAPKGFNVLNMDAQGRVNSTNNAWCAVFIDHVLRGIGAKPLDPATAPRGSKEKDQRKYAAMRAFEYENYGDSVKTTDAKAGDMVILKGSHIGIYTGKKDANGNMLVLGGNQSTKTSGKRGVAVTVSPYATNKIKSVRRISNIDDLPADTLKAITKDMTGTAAGTR